MHTSTNNEKRVCEFEGEQGTVCVKVWKKEKERGNGVIKLQSQQKCWIYIKHKTHREWIKNTFWFKLVIYEEKYLSSATKLIFF